MFEEEDEKEVMRPKGEKEKKFITGQLNNWTWVGFFENMGKKFCNASSNVLFNIFNKMNSNLAYFDVSHNIEILH